MILSYLDEWTANPPNLANSDGCYERQLRGKPCRPLAVARMTVFML
jgi:hypothetical protein